MAKCKYCGRRIQKVQVLCPWCVAWLTERGAWQPELPDVPVDEVDSNKWGTNYRCEMCNRGEARLRTDGGLYCDECWKIWAH